MSAGRTLTQVSGLSSSPAPRPRPLALAVRVQLYQLYGFTYYLSYKVMPLCPIVHALYRVVWHESRPPRTKAVPLRVCPALPPSSAERSVLIVGGRRRRRRPPQARSASARDPCRRRKLEGAPRRREADCRGARREAQTVIRQMKVMGAPLPSRRRQPPTANAVACAVALRRGQQFDSDEAVPGA